MNTNNSKLKQLFPKWLIIILSTTIIGIIFITIYYSKQGTAKILWVEILGTIGKTVLGSGVFFAILKSIQFLGIFREELHQIMYSEQFLKKRNDLRQIWKSVTGALYETAFPTISNKIEDIVQQMLPDKLNYYHKNLYVVYEINKIDNDHFEIIESQNFIIASDGKEFTFSLYNFFIKTSNENDKSSFMINLTIDGKDYEIIPSEPIPLEDAQIETIYNFSEQLGGNNEYNVKKTTRSVHTNLMNGYWKFEIGRITDSFTIDIRNNGNYELDLIPIGQNTTLKKMFISSTLNINQHYDIMMPGDGFIILIKPKLR